MLHFGKVVSNLLFPRFVFLVAILSIAVMAPWALVHLGTANASHPYGDARHQYFIHWNSTGHGALDEDYCVDSHDSGMSDATAKSRVQSTLMSDGSHWDLIGSGKLDLYTASNPCLSYSDRSWIEIEFHVYSNPSSFCWNETGISCVHQIDLVGGYHYRYQNVYLKTSHVDGPASEYHQTINHEFGHVLGLRDPSTTDGSDCSPSSIMHTFAYYGCGYVEYPTEGDISSVVNNVMPLEY